MVDQLPLECLAYIFSFLSTSDWYSCQFVCSAWSDATSSNDRKQRRKRVIRLLDPGSRIESNFSVILGKSQSGKSSLARNLCSLQKTVNPVFGVYNTSVDDSQNLYAHREFSMSVHLLPMGPLQVGSLKKVLDASADSPIVVCDDMGFEAGTIVEDFAAYIKERKGCFLWALTETPTEEHNVWTAVDYFFVLPGLDIHKTFQICGHLFFDDKQEWKGVYEQRKEYECLVVDRSHPDDIRMFYYQAPYGSSD